MIIPNKSLVGWQFSSTSFYFKKETWWIGNKDFYRRKTLLETIFLIPNPQTRHPDRLPDWRRCRSPRPPPPQRASPSQRQPGDTIEKTSKGWFWNVFLLQKPSKNLLLDCVWYKKTSENQHFLVENPRLFHCALIFLGPPIPDFLS